MNRDGSIPLDQVLLRLVRSRLFIPLLAVSLAAIVVAGLLGVQMLENQQQQAVQSHAAMVDRYLDQADRMLDAVAWVAGNSTPEETRTYMQGTLEAYRYFDTLYYLDRDNQIVQMVPLNVRYVGLDMFSMPFYRMTGEQINYRISRPFISLRTGNPTVYIIRDVPSGGAIVGELNLDALQQEIMASKNMPGRDFVFILDQYGVLIAHPSAELVRQQTNQGDLVIFQRGIAGQATLPYMYDGTLVLGSAARVDPTGWVVVDQVPVITVFGPFIFILGVTVVVLLLIWLLLAWNLRARLRREVIVPLERFSGGVAALAEGNFGQSSALPPVAGTFVELDRLATDFRHMNTAIQERQTALEQSREELLRKNEDLHAAYEQLTANEEELRENFEELRERENVIRESEEKYRTLVETTATGFVIIDTDGRVLDANPEYIRMSGHTNLDEIIGRNVIEWTAKDDREKNAEAVRQCMRDGFTRNFEVNYADASGNITPVEINATVLRSGTTVQIHTLCRDITERKRAEKERLANIFFFESMDKVNQAIQGTNDLEQMMSDVLDTVLSIFDCDRAWLLYPCDPEATSWRTPMERTKPEYPGVYALGLEILMDEGVAESFRALLASEGPVKFGPGTGHSMPENVSNQFGFKSFMSMALHPKIGKAWQFGLHQCSYPRIWTSDEEKLLQEIGRRLADSLTSLLTYRSLKESERKFRAIFDQTFEFIGLMTPDGTLLEANRTSLKFGGQQESDVLGKPMWETPFWSHSEDLQEKLRAAVQAAAQGEFIRFEATHVAADGSLHYIDFSIKPVRDEAGRVILLIPEGRDVTERKRAEEIIQKSGREWQTTFNAITDAVFLLDDKGRIIRHNRALELFTGKTADEIDGRYCYEVMHGTTSPIEGCPNVKAQKSRERESIELKIGSRWVIIAVDPIISETGTYSGAVHLLIDITERKQAEEALNHARRKLNFLNAITFSDIQNSIFSLSGYLELEKTLPMDEKLRQFKEKEEKIVQTVTESLKFTGIYQGLGLKPPLWQNVNQCFLFGISHLDISPLSRRLDVGGVEIYADPLLENVFFTLAENVIRHARTATELTLRYHESPEGLTLFFEDNGTGVPMDLKEKIFEREYGRRKGSGLFLVREILSITGITMKETGEPGKGARFEIQVPAEGYRFTRDH